MEIYFALYLIAYFTLHSVLADKKVKDFLINRLIPKRFYRITYNLVAISLLFPIFAFIPQIEPTTLLKASFWSYFGISLFSIGFICLLIALSQYNLPEFAGTAQLRTDAQPVSSTLKVSGFNAIVRHPLYFSMLLMAWGFFLAYPTDLAVTITCIVTIYLYVGTRLVERKLISEFGDAYLEYQKKVGMLLPFKVFTKN